MNVERARASLRVPVNHTQVTEVSNTVVSTAFQKTRADCPTFHSVVGLIVGGWLSLSAGRSTSQVKFVVEFGQLLKLRRNDEQVANSDAEEERFGGHGGHSGGRPFAGASPDLSGVSCCQRAC